MRAIQCVVGGERENESYTVCCGRRERERE